MPSGLFPWATWTAALPGTPLLQGHCKGNVVRSDRTGGGEAKRRDYTPAYRQRLCIIAPGMASPPSTGGPQQMRNLRSTAMQPHKRFGMTLSRRRLPLPPCNTAAIPPVYLLASYCTAATYFDVDGLLTEGVSLTHYRYTASASGAVGFCIGSAGRGTGTPRMDFLVQNHQSRGSPLFYR